MKIVKLFSLGLVFGVACTIKTVRPEKCVFEIDPIALSCEEVTTAVTFYIRYNIPIFKTKRFCLMLTPKLLERLRDCAEEEFTPPTTPAPQWWEDEEEEPIFGRF